MTMRIAIDTAVLAALVDTRDKWHAAAVLLRDALKSALAEVSYFDPILSETVSVLSRRLTEQKRLEQFVAALDNLENLVPSEQITWVSPEIVRLYSQIMALVRAHRGELNFNDALIALACRELGVHFIASFDRDFDSVDWLVRFETPDDVRAATRS